MAIQIQKDIITLIDKKKYKEIIETVNGMQPFLIGAENFKRNLREITDKNYLILDLSGVPFIDETGILVLLDIIKGLQEKGKNIYIGGLNRRPLKMLIRMGVVDSLGRNRVFRKMESAIKRAFLDASQDGEDKCAYEPLGNA